MPARDHLIGSLDGPLSLRWQPRRALIDLACIALALALVAIALRSGRLGGDGADPFALLRSDAPSRLQTIVLHWRLPRALFALVFGAALGMSGALFQSLIRNPLGSPDLVGFNSGAHTGALVVITLLHGGHGAIALGAIVGGLGAAALVWLLSAGRGLQGLRLILIGVGVSALLGAVNLWLSLRADLDTAMGAALWGAGSLNGMSWAKGLPAAAIAVAALCIGCALARRLRLLELGDASAGTLGVPVRATRNALLALGVILSAAATAACGPIAFVALAAPAIARRLGGGLHRSAVVGALLLLGADLLAQHAFAPHQLPVGLVTSCLGGVYLVVLLLRRPAPLAPT
ncbi:MAG TPA: iron chelate uptake ABC transporter family permease subunit [Tahibacter sp.]|uniref:iron chelate uptake ABC transporter family permease subunit n=1 Tax=Tahibacter sp. TaxID=2056211 RepID=UPI002C04B791|nr:iron chelate uptake ABC transporter family permease subunit [Tahibacter sp.]HSX61725.1 iron chelate uptake ABC transporter family permease subunit [Tahibacter sp.]